MSKGPATVLLGVCGGIAAYKAVDVASRLRKAGLEVHVAMTEAARAFIAPLTFAAITGHPALEKLLPDGPAAGQSAYPHLYPATRADAFVVLPATANTIAKLACGLANDPVSAAALSLPATCLRVICPAMNVEMWRNPVVQANVRRLEALGWHRIGPASGPLACGMEGEGRMSEPAEIVDTVSRLMRLRTPLSGKRVLILSGPTREHIDPVRFIGNASSGKMGRALALAAMESGATVDFITGPVPDENLPRVPGIEIEQITSAEQLLQSARARFPRADIILYAAAVADYRPAGRAHAQKLPKKDAVLDLQLEPTPDIAATLNQEKRPGQLAIGFALQTHDGVEYARKKLAQKRFDAIVLNSIDAMGGDAGTYQWILPGREPEDWGTLNKTECARRIVARTADMLGRTAQAAAE